MRNDNISKIQSNEIWRPVAVVGFEDYYEVSDGGHIRRAGAIKALKGSLSNKGYICVKLSRPGECITKTLHKLISTVFYGPCPERMEVNHKDKVKTNNVLSNLEYVTPSENQKHNIRHGRKIAIGQNHGQAKLTENQVLEIRHCLQLGSATPLKLSIKYNVTRQLIYDIKHNRVWRHLENGSS